MEFKESEPRSKSAKSRFKLSAGLNLQTFDTILSGTNHLSRSLNLKLKFFKFGHWLTPVHLEDWDPCTGWYHVCLKYWYSYLLDFETMVKTC